MLDRSPAAYSLDQTSLCTLMRPHYSSEASPLHKRLDNGVGGLTLCFQKIFTLLN